MKLRLITYLFLAVLVCSSCEKESRSGRGIKYLSFKASVNAALEYEVKSTNANDKKFAVDTHNMGLWICDANNSPILSEFNNCRMEYTRNVDETEKETEKWKFFKGNEQLWEDVIPVDDARVLNIYSYYPYNENINDITSIPFVTGTQNYFYSEPVQFTDAVMSENKVDVTLEYKPIMTCLEIAIVANSDNAIKLNELTLSVLENSNGIPTKGTYNAITGEISASSEETIKGLSFVSDAGVVLTTDEKTTPVVSFIFPKYLNYNKDFALSFKFNGREGLTAYTIPNDLVQNTEGYFKEGYKYSITLHLNEEMKFSVVEFITTDWNNNPVVETDIQM